MARTKIVEKPRLSGRPKLAPGKAKSVRINFLCYPKDAETWKTQAALEGISLGEWLAQQANKFNRRR